MPNLYKQDERGEYRVVSKWIEAWSGGGFGIIPGYNVVELRQYADGGLVQHISERVVYTNEAPVEIAALHAVYIVTQATLIRYLERKENEENMDN